MSGDRADARAAWARLDDRVRGWWDQDRTTATAEDVVRDGAGTLLELPRPYSTAGGDETAFPEMYGWDTHFINLGMLEHGRADLVRDHLVNQLAMIERYGMVLNGNRTYYLTRSQPPVLADSIARYLHAVGDDPEIVDAACVLLAREYEDYWGAPHHATAVGLTTNRDLGDPRLRTELAAEAETGLDFTAIFSGDVRRCVPLITNACLVRQASVLFELHARRGDGDQALRWRDEAARRAALIRRLCWSEEAGFFREYNVESESQLPFDSLSAYWVMWAGAATTEQAERMLARLADFRGAYGLAFTPSPLESPHPEFENLQWQWPVGWPPMQIVVVQALERYGWGNVASAIAADFVNLQVAEYDRSGSLWEKYNVVRGGVELPVERYQSVPMHGWSSASVAVLGTAAYGRPRNEARPRNETKVARP